MTGWKADKRWSDQFLPEIRSILGRILICEPPEEEDQKRNTDLIVLKMDSVRIGCRIRKESYFTNQYRRQFTIRKSRPSGTPTELEKIQDGWGDYFFYGFGGDGKLLGWAVGDLDVFREWIPDNMGRGEVHDNHDNSSSLVAFSWWDLPSQFVVSSWNLPTRLPSRPMTLEQAVAEANSYGNRP